MSIQILKDAGLSGVNDSSSSSGSRGGRVDEPHPIPMVTATGVIDLDPVFGQPTTRIVDDATERASVCKASTSGAVAPTILTNSDLLRIWFQYGIPEFVELMLPKPDEHVDLADDDWTCFCELPFRQGLRFPIPYLIRRLLALLDMALAS
ncbi:hypothetical protein ACOSQ2_019608 [Xanthoceras sorbifolium]